MASTETENKTASSSDVAEVEERFATLAVRNRRVHSTALKALATPIVNASTFELDDAAHGLRLSAKKPGARADEDGFFYNRWCSPTTQAAEEVIADFEGAKFSMVFSSGMAAIASALTAQLGTGDHAVAPFAVYGGTYEWLSTYGKQFGIEVTFVDSSDIGAYERAIKPNTKVVYAETPSNPTLAVTDLAALGKVCAKHDDLLLVVDSTVASPYHQQPLGIEGVDVVLHSATKFLGGHSDLLAGAVATNSEKFAHSLGRTRRLFGGNLGAQDAFLLIRGTKTLDVRMERHARNAMAVAEFLSAHPMVEKCFYPGLPSHPSHEIAKRQMKNGFGGMLSFEVKASPDGSRSTLQNAQRVAESVRTIKLAVSLGGVESLIEHPNTMTHAHVPDKDRLQGGFTDGLVRLSVGLEHQEDLIVDLKQALEQIS